ncbi:acyltransferase 3 [Segniliparus rotundus DSM 44985]|uniref:Acyltransferase 3 n=1 Tax=Segniliparus rotundus (strain ATCC BAA-972 / CDC 1076 / CIP 108378 / DSM 44985 / JCM 13578) TaxID=640132 RepID=D6Z9U7_SEGRD|nr:acyltransferase 3 [Segniliparus rotundus DSM 44985]
MSQTTASASREFLPALQGLRWFSALAVLGTHTAFLTGAGVGHWYQHVFSRLDLAVAVFFALSGFLLWRPHAACARGRGAAPRLSQYYRSRAARILPAYWVVVCVVLVSVRADARVWFANLALAQPFVPFTLATGLTQMWSLSVEVSFYLVLPACAAAMSKLEGAHARWRAPALLAVSAVSLGWAFLPWPDEDFANPKLWLPGYLPWFAAGMVLSELRSQGWAVRGRSRWACLLAAVVSFGLECTGLGGPPDLTLVQPWQFATKIGLGAVLAAALLAPAALAGPQSGHRVLAHPVTLALGRWSYSFFLWHLAVLGVLLPILGLPASGVRIAVAFVVAMVFSVGVSALSYAWVEFPCARRWGSSRPEGAAPSKSAEPSKITEQTAPPSAISASSCGASVLPR